MKNPERLHDHPSFAHFGALHLHQLSECLTSRRYEGEDVLYREADTSADFFLVEEGSVRLSRTTAFGEFDLQIAQPDEVFGAAGFVDHLARGVDASTLEAARLVAFDTLRLRDACQHDNKFEIALYWSLWKVLSLELRRANDRLGKFFAADNQLSDSLRPASAPLGSSDSFDISTKLGLFREQKLSPMEIHFLASLSREERFAPGQTVFREGEPGEKMYVVAEGRVMISKNIAGVGEEALAFLTRGDYFGEMALIDKKPRSADARAHPQTGAVVLALPRNVVEGILDIDKISSIRLLKLLCGFAAKRVREIHEKLVGWFLLSGGELEMSAESISEA